MRNPKDSSLKDSSLKDSKDKEQLRAELQNQEKIIIDIIKTRLLGFSGSMDWIDFQVKSVAPDINARHDYQRDIYFSKHGCQVIYKSNLLFEIKKYPKEELIIFEIDGAKSPKGYKVSKILEKVLYYKFPEIKFKRIPIGSKMRPRTNQLSNSFFTDISNIRTNIERSSDDMPF